MSHSTGHHSFSHSIPHPTGELKKKHSHHQPNITRGPIVNPTISAPVVSAFSSNAENWQNALLEGLVVEGGKPNKIRSGFITKANVHNQIPEHMVPSIEVMSNPYGNGKLMDKSKSKQRFSIHRSMSFLPQE